MLLAASKDVKNESYYMPLDSGPLAIEWGKL